MRPDELEQRLRAEASAMRERAPDTVRPAVRRRLERGHDRQAPRWLPLAVAAGLAAIVVIFGLPQPGGPGPAGPERAPARIADLPAVQPAAADRLVAWHEAGLRAEWRDIRADLQRIREAIDPRG